MAKAFKILLVEDNADDEQLTLRILKKLGSQIQVEVARDGEEALNRIFGNVDDLPDLILTDLRLPKVTGFEAIRRLREYEPTKDLKVIVLSSPDEPEEVRVSYMKYANGFIHKPVTLEAFAEVANTVGISLER